MEKKYEVVKEGESVGEESPEAKELRMFFSRHIPIENQDFMDGANLGQLFRLYMEVLNSPPSLDSLKKILLEQLPDSPEFQNERTDIESRTLEGILDGNNKEQISVKFRQYLVEKLPIEHLKRYIEMNAEKSIEEKLKDMNEEEMYAKFKNTEIEFKLKKIPPSLVKEELRKEMLKSMLREFYSEPANYNDFKEQFVQALSFKELIYAHKRMEDGGSGNIYGFYTSDREYKDFAPVSKLPAEVLVGGENISVPAGYVHWSLNYKKLYKGGHYGGNPRYLYVVEASRFIMETVNKTGMNEAYYSKSGDKQWLLSAAPLPIRGVIKLTPEIIQELGLGFE